MTLARIRIATRNSALALWQANHVKQQLISAYPDLVVDIIGMTTEGDRRLASSLAKIGGKGLFIKELEHALLNDEADIAVHSMKDLPMRLPDNLAIGAICSRADPRDALLANDYSALSELPPGSVVGTSSLRRQALLHVVRPDLQVKLLRGNVATRIQKLDQGEFDAIILAAAGLKRLQLNHRITELLASDVFIPAVGQGAIGIEYATQNTDVGTLLSQLNDTLTAACVNAERAISRQLDGSCQLPLAGFAELSGAQLKVTGFVAMPDGSQALRAYNQGEIADAEALGSQVAQQLIAQGAQMILDQVKHDQTNTL